MNWKAWLLACLIAVILGFGIAVWRIAHFEHSPVIRTYGSWKGTTNLPLNKNNLLTTQVTLFALFALPSPEALYFFIVSDENGKDLTGDSLYTIQGNVNDIKAEYWSITAYGNDLYLIPNEQRRFSFNRDNLVTDSAGNFKITLSGNQSAGNWLPVQKDKNFGLVLRIYRGDSDFIAHLDRANLPSLKRN